MVARCLVGGVAVFLTVQLGADGPDMAVINAVKSRDTAAIRVLLNQGKDVNGRHADGATALHWAVHEDDLATADLLIRARARVNATNDLGVTPLWIAASNGSAAMLTKLLEAGANPNLAPSTGGTPLMRAVRTGSVDAVQALLRYSANVEARESAGDQTALMWSVAQRHTRVVQALIAAGANLEARSKVSREYVLTCCQTNNGDGIGAIWLEQGGYTALLFAARLGDLETAQILVAAGAQVNVTAPAGTSALVVAAHSGHGALAAYLLDNGADPNAAGAGYTALHAAVLRDDLNLVRTLLEHGANPDARLTNGTPARRAARDFAFYRSWVGATPFWLAAAFHKPAYMQVLAASGSDTGLPANDGTTPLMAAVRGESPRALFQDGSPVFPAGEENTALDTAKVLLTLGTDVNAMNDAGDTALHRAASRRFNSVIQLLVDNGAKVNVQDKQGRTPLQCAMLHCHLLTDTKGAFVAQDFRAVADGGDAAAIALIRRLGGKE